jgi:hypothetical protein
MVKKARNIELGEPIQLDLTQRYFQFNRQFAVRDVFDGLVELITNSDDSYHRLHTMGTRDEDGGPILIEIQEQRKGRPSTIRVRDRAEGMTLDDMLVKLGTVGDRRSAEGDRGFMARGARDCTELGEMLVESVKDGRYYACRLTTTAQIIPLNDGQEVNDSLIDSLGIRRRENGTVVSLTIEARHPIPRVGGRLMRELPWHFALRDIMSEQSATQVLVKNLNTPQEAAERLMYRRPDAELVVDENIDVPGYPEATARLQVWRASEAFETTGDRRFRRSGLVIKGKRAIHECSLLSSEFENDPHGARYFGRIECPFIDVLLSEYDDCRAEGHAFPEHNPRLLIDPNRQTGLIRQHPFTGALFQVPTERLRALIAEDRKAAQAQRHEIANRRTKQRLSRLAKAASRFMHEQMEDLSELAAGEDVDNKLFHQVGSIIYPTYIRLGLGEEKTLWMYVSRQYTSSDHTHAAVSADSDAITVLDSILQLSPHPRKEDRLFGTFRIRAEALSDATCVEARVNGLPPAEAIVEVTEQKAEHREFKYPLEFEHAQYRVREGGTRKLRLYAMHPDLVSAETPVKVWTEGDDGVAIRGRCEVVPVAGSNFAQASVTVQGRRLKSNVKIGAFVNGRQAHTFVRVIEKDGGSVPIKIGIRDEDYGNFRAIWAEHEGEPNLLLVSARHKSLRRYLGPAPDFQGQDSPVFRLLLAEIVAESVCRKVLALEAQERAWEFHLADLKDDRAIVDDVLARLHRKIRDFVAEAHAIMLSDREIEELA